MQARPNRVNDIHHTLYAQTCSSSSLRVSPCPRISAHREPKKTISAPKRTSTTRLRIPETHLHQSPCPTSPRDHPPNPRASSSRSSDLRRQTYWRRNGGVGSVRARRGCCAGGDEAAKRVETRQRMLGALKPRKFTRGDSRVSRRAGRRNGRRGRPPHLPRRFHGRYERRWWRYYRRAYRRPSRVGSR